MPPSPADCSLGGPTPPQEKRTARHTHPSLPPSYTMHSQMRFQSSQHDPISYLLCTNALNRCIVVITSSSNIHRTRYPGMKLCVQKLVLQPSESGVNLFLVRSLSGIRPRGCVGIAWQAMKEAKAGGKDETASPKGKSKADSSAKSRMDLTMGRRTRLRAPPRRWRLTIRRRLKNWCLRRSLQRRWTFHHVSVGNEAKRSRSSSRRVHRF